LAYIRLNLKRPTVEHEGDLQ